MFKMIRSIGLLGAMSAAVVSVATLRAAEVTHRSSVSPANTIIPAVENQLRSPAWARVPIEELAKYDYLFAVSDIHGTLDKFVNLLAKATTAPGLPSSGITTPNGQTWLGENKPGKRYLLVLAGDYIDKGDYSIQVLNTIMSLQEQAKAKGGRVIAVMGNHEVDLIADPSSASKKLLDSARGKGFKDGNKLDGNDIVNKSRVGAFLKSLPAAAMIGNWMFAHSGYISTPGVDKKDDLSDKNLSSRRLQIVDSFLKDLYSDRNSLRWDDLTDQKRNAGARLIAAHDWWEVKVLRGNVQALLNEMGVSMLFVGHEPGLLSEPGRIKSNGKGWFVKLDAGMNPEAADSDGKLLRCKISDVLVRDAAKPTQIVEQRFYNGPAEDERSPSVCDEVDHYGRAIKVQRHESNKPTTDQGPEQE